MFTDMAGYTALGQRNELLSLALAEEQRRLLRPVFSRHNGREIKTIGDAFLVKFGNALDAVRCAYDVQRASREFNISQPNDQRLILRIGLHLGDVVESEGDISGDAVNIKDTVIGRGRGHLRHAAGLRPSTEQIRLTTQEPRVQIPEERERAIGIV